MQNPSMRFATRARKALINIKTVAHALGLELLSLYAPSQNKGREQINPFEYKNGRSGKYNYKVNSNQNKKGERDNDSRSIIDGQ